MPSIRSALLASALALTACTEASSLPVAPPPGSPLGGASGSSAGHIELRRLDARPRLTLVSRDGDPTPAVAAVFVTGLGPALTTALAAVVESRLRTAGFDADVRVDRDAFRARILVPDPARVPALFTALAAAASRPVAPGSAEIARALQRLQSLRRNPLDAPELAPIAACTGALGLAPGDPVPDLATETGARDLEAARRAALHVGNVSLAAVGPAAFGPVVARALEHTDGWPPLAVAPSDEVAPAADTTGAYTATSLDRRSARLTLAVRVADPALAAAAAERLGAPDSPLVARLRLLNEPWRVVQIAGVARAHGGCVSAVLEMAPHAPRQPLEPAAAQAAIIARREILAELAVTSGSSIAPRQILTAADPREAASRAAWWAIVAPATPAASSPAAPPAPLRWATALGLPAIVVPPRDAPPPAPSGPRFQAEIDRALSASASSGAERHLAAERGQGELWLLLASPCGAAEEGPTDAGLGALAALAAVEARRRSADVALEPWITPDGIGVLAHAPFRDDRETPAELARRVADAAARALTATTLPPEALAEARAAVLDHLERSAGHQGTAFEALAPAIAPEHPSWLDPFGLWTRVAGAPAEGVRVRGQALAWGPLRLAVLANTDAAQAAAAADAADRWLSPAPGPRVCRAGAASPSHPGHLDVRLASDAGLAQGLLGAPFPAPPTPGAAYPYRNLADLTAAALDGPGGLLAATLAGTGAAATATARVMGGGRAPTLIVDVRAPEGDLAAAVGDVKALLLRLPTTAADADLARAASAVERREQDARAEPRRRLVDLWSERRGPTPARPSLATWRAFLASTLRDAALVVVEARAE